MCVRARVCVCACVCACACVRVRVCVCVCIYIYLYIFVHGSSPIGFLLQGIVLPSNPYRKPRLRKLKRCREGRRVAASYVLFICKPNVATDLPLTKDYPSHDSKPRTKQSHLTLERTCQTKRLSLFKPPLRLVSSSPVTQTEITHFSTL